MRMVISVLLLTMMSIVTSLHVQDIDKEWYRFKAKFNRTYNSSSEERYRHSIFAQNLKKIYFHNKAADLGRFTYWLGVNKFSDMTSEEFRRKYANIKLTSRDNNSHAAQKSKFKNKYNRTLPDQKDWRNKRNNKSCVTGVKDQGNYNTCYAFAAAAVLESHNCLEFGNLDTLSEQNIIDCSTTDGYGSGGSPLSALKYAMQNGLDTEASYPYRGEVGKCNQSSGQLGAWVEEIEQIWPFGNVRRLKEAVAFEGPLSVCIDTGNDSTFHQYSSGVYYNPKCGYTRTVINHALLLIGYGVTAQGEQYWLLKNSYGVDWGEEGYMRLKRNDSVNTCGIATFALYPIEDK